MTDLQYFIFDRNGFLIFFSEQVPPAPIEVLCTPCNHLIEVKHNVKKSVLLNGQTKHTVILSVANCARFYALLKFHKPTLAFRLIVFNIGTASCKLALFLSHSLALLICNNLYTVKNSFDFAEKLKLIISPTNYTMLSLDVKSLFTNVKIQRALDCMEKRLREFHYSSVEVEEILNLVYLYDTGVAESYIFNTNIFV